MRLFILAMLAAMAIGIGLRRRPDQIRYAIGGLTLLVTLGYYFFRQI